MEPRRALRSLAAIGVVALWMALGWAFHLGANAYLLVGVPLMLAFQRWVHRRPIADLWVRDAERMTPGRGGARTMAALALALAIVPGWSLARAIAAGRDVPTLLWLGCALLGAGAAAFALVHLTRASLRPTLACLAVVSGIGVGIMLLAWAARGMPAGRGVVHGLRWLLLYFPVTFVLEEVFFRGMLDTYVQRPGEAHGRTTAVAVSVLWALWHLPVVPWNGPGTILSLLVVHVTLGIPLSLYWRQSGNLTGPAAAHAVIDAVRNALLH